MISIELEKEEINEVCNKAISNENNGKDNWKGLYGSWYSIRRINDCFEIRDNINNNILEVYGDVESIDYCYSGIFKFFNAPLFSGAGADCYEELFGKKNSNVKIKKHCKYWCCDDGFEKQRQKIVDFCIDNKVKIGVLWACYNDNKNFKTIIDILNEMPILNDYPNYDIFWNVLEDLSNDNGVYLIYNFDETIE